MSYPNLPATNPLLDFSDLPWFDRIQPEHVGPAVDALIAKDLTRGLSSRLILLDDHVELAL